MPTYADRRKHSFQRMQARKLAWRICRAIGCLLAVAVLYGQAERAFAGKEEPRPDPAALFQGIEESRRQVTSGRFEYIITTSGTAPQLRHGEKITLSVILDGSKYNFEHRQRTLVVTEPNISAKWNQLEAMNFDRERFVKAGLGKWEDIHTRTAFNGPLVYRRVTSGEGVISPAEGEGSAGKSVLAFDPRTLGIALNLILSESVEDCLPYQRAKTMQCLGRKAVANSEAWHVIVRLEKPTIELHFWIDDREGFRVYRYEAKIGSVKHIITSSYEGAQVGQLPTRVVKEVIGRDGKLRRKVEIEQVRASYGDTISPETFTLAGLDLAAGVPVVDARIKRQIGYWNGRDTSETLSEALRIWEELKAERERSQSYLYYSLVAGAVLLAILAVFVLRRRARRAAR